jgi:hypothetical protein
VQSTTLLTVTHAAAIQELSAMFAHAAAEQSITVQLHLTE